MLRPSKGVTNAMIYSQNNYFKYDPFKHGDQLNTRVPDEYASPLIVKKNTYKSFCYNFNENAMKAHKP